MPRPNAATRSGRGGGRTTFGFGVSRRAITIAFFKFERALIDLAARRTAETANEVNLVGSATQDTRASAVAVKAVADDLGSVAGRIRGQVDQFFERLSA